MSIYKINKRLPEYIDVARIEDIFWNNNSDLYPNRTPDKSKYTKIDQVQPVFQSPYMGTIVLQGEWNHAFYNGTYYFLIKLEVQDVMNQVYKYQLINDVMMNFLDAGGEIRGSLIRTNKEEILSKVIQSCHPVLSSPSKIVFGKFAIEDLDWTKTCKLYLTPDTEKFQEVYIFKQAWDQFVFNIRNNFLYKEMKKKKWEYKEDQDKNEYIRPSLFNDLIVLDQLLTIKAPSWKNKIVKIIRDNFSSFEDKQIATQTQIQGSYFQGKKAITWKDNSIGQHIESTYKLLKLDLSGLTDIIPINFSGKPLDPNVELTADLLPNSSEIGDVGVYNPRILRPIPRLPIKNKNLPWTEDMSVSGYYSNSANFDDSNYKGQHPQRLTFHWGADLIGKGKGSDGFLWWLPRNNLSLTAESPIGEYDNFGVGFTDNIRSYSPDRDYRDQYFFNRLNRKDCPPLGFMIWELKRLPGEWDDYEYTGSTPLKNVEYRSGLTNLLSRKYSDTRGKWWSTLPSKLSYLRGVQELTYHMLDTDLMTWLTIVPTDKEYGFYKYSYYLNWGIKELFPDRNDGWIARIMNFDINNNGVHIESPLKDNLIHNWIRERYKKIEEISTYESIEDAPEVKQGDILFTTYEYALWPIYDPYNQFPITLDKSTIDEYLSKMKQGYPNRGSDSKELKVSEDFVKRLHDVLNERRDVRFGLASIPIIGFIAVTTQIYAQDHHIRRIITLSSKSWPYIYNAVRFPSDRVIFYYHKGKFKVGYTQKYKRTLQLTNHITQIVERVDGVSSLETQLIHLRGIDLEPNFINNDLLNEAKEREILSKLGAAVRGSKNGRVFEYTDESLSVGDHWFNLEGTNWILYLRDGKPHLIAKKEEGVFTKPELKVADLKFITETLPTTYEQINQKGELNFYGETMPLNTKFNFRDDKFNIEVADIVIEDKVTPIETYHIKIENDHDFFNTWVKINKKMATAITKEINPVELEMLKHQIEGSTLKYQQDRENNDRMLIRRNVEMVRRREDLDMQWWDNMINSVTVGLMGGGISANRLIKSDSVIGKVTGAAGLGLAAAKTAYDIYRNQRNYNIQTARLSEDKQILYAENLQAMYHRKQNYEHEYKGNLIHLNGLTQTFIRGGINDRELQEEFNNKHGLSNINVQVLLPSIEQSRIITKIYDVYGCECLSPEYEVNPLHVKNGITGLYQFSKLLGDGIKSILASDAHVNATIRHCFQTGVKFTEVEHKFLEQDFSIQAEPEEDLEERSFDVENIAEWPREKWDLYYYLHDKQDIINALNKLPNKGLTDEEKHNNPGVVNQLDRQLLEKVNEIIRHRDTGVAYVIPTEPTAPVDKTKEEVARLTNQVISLQQELTDLIKTSSDDKTKLETEKRRYLGELKTLQTKITQLEEHQKDNLKTREEELNKQLQLHTTAMSNKQQELDDLQQKQEQCKVDIATRDTLIETLRQGTTSSQEDTARLQAQITQLKQQKQSLDTNKRQLQTKLEEANKKLTEANNSITDLRKQLKDSQTDKTTLQTQLNERIEEIVTLEGEKETLQEKLNKTKEEMKTLNTQITGCQTKQTTNSELQEKIKTLEAEKSKIQEDLNNINQIATNARIQYSELEQQKTECEEQLKVLREMSTQEINKLKVEIDTLKNKPQEEGDVEKLKRIIQGLQNEVTLQKLEVRRQQTAATSATNRAETLSREYKTLEGKYQTAEQLRKLYLDEKTKLSQDLTKCQNQLQAKTTIPETVTSVQNKLREAEERIKTLQKEKGDTEGRYQSIWTQLTQAREQLAKCSIPQKPTPTQEELERLKRQLAESERLLKAGCEPIYNAFMVKKLAEEAKAIADTVQSSPTKECMSVDGSVVGFPKGTMFPRREYPTPPTKETINEWPGDERTRFENGYYQIKYRGTRGDVTVWIYKPWTPISHSLLFIQNLINCVFDSMFASTQQRLVDFTKTPFNIIINKEQFLYRWFNFETNNKNVKTVRFSELNIPQEDVRIGNLILNAIFRTSTTIEMDKESGYSGGDYLNTRLRELPDRTSTKVPPIIFKNGKDTLSKFIKYTIYMMRTKPWDEAYPIIKSTIKDWNWLKRP